MVLMIKDTRLVVRISTEDLDSIKIAAKKSGKNFSDFVLGAVKVQMGELDNLESRICKLETSLSR
jgi:uncharacterized protein (DUF1778 family)